VTSRPATRVHPMRRSVWVRRLFRLRVMSFVIVFVSCLGEAWTVKARAMKVLSAK